MDVNSKIQLKSKKWKIPIFIVIILLISSFSIFFFFKKENENYITTNPVIEDISQFISATGTLSPINTIEVGSQISGTILEVLVDVNDRVKKGQVLAKIDPEKLNQNVDNYKAQLQSAKARLYSAEVLLENKKWSYDNYLALYEKTNGKSPSKMQLKTSELDYKSALADIEVQKASISQLETSLNAAKIDVKNSIIISPVDGIVLSKKIEIGQTVAANFETPKLFEIAQDLGKMKLVSNVLEADIGKVKVGQDIDFFVDAYPDEVFTSKVAKVNFADIGSTSKNSNSSSTPSNIVSYEVTTYVDNKNLLLRPGMSASANIKTASIKNALVIPTQALSFNPNLGGSNKKSFNVNLKTKRIRKTISRTRDGLPSNIWILKDNGEIEELEIIVGISSGGNIEVKEGDIKETTKVILQKI